MKKRDLICTLGALFYLYDYFIQVTPSVMKPWLMRDFGLNATHFSLLGASFLIPYALMQIPAGLLLDRFGARRLLTAAASLSALALALFSSTASFSLAIGCRALLGCAAAVSFISAIYLIANWFSHRWFAPLAGMVQTSACVGSILGLAPIAYALTLTSWQTVILWMSALTLVLSLLFWWLIEDTPLGHIVITENNNRITAGLRALQAQPRLWWIFIIDLFAWAPVSSLGALWGVPYLMEAKSVTALEASHLCNFFWLGLGCGSILIGYLSEKIQRRCLPIIICFIIGTYSSACLLSAHSLSIPIISLCLFGLGSSAATQTLTFSLLKDNAPPHVFGCLSGFNNMASILGGAGAQIIMGILIQSHHHATTTLLGYQHALTLLPLCAISGLVITIFFIQETHCRSQSHEKKRI